MGDSAVTRFAGSESKRLAYLGLAPQALCFRPLRGLSRSGEAPDLFEGAFVLFEFLACFAEFAL